MSGNISSTRQLKWNIRAVVTMAMNKSVQKLRKAGMKDGETDLDNYILHHMINLIFQSFDQSEMTIRFSKCFREFR